MGRRALGCNRDSESRKWRNDEKTSRPEKYPWNDWQEKKHQKAKEIDDVGSSQETSSWERSLPVTLAETLERKMDRTWHVCDLFDLSKSALSLFSRF